MGLENIRAFLSGTQSGIQDYCDECINHEKIFFYSSGERKGQLFDFDIQNSKDWKFVKPFPTTSIAISGGVPLARAFNRHMLIHVKKNFSTLTEGKK